jgi:hypothetical protein
MHHALRTEGAVARAVGDHHQVPSHEQSVTITKDNYVQQTFHVTLGPQPDHSFWENPPPTLKPNPVRAVLQPVPKPAARHTLACTFAGFPPPWSVDHSPSTRR